MNSTSGSIHVEVAYALPHKQKIVPLNVHPGTTALEAVVLSNIANEFPGIDIERTPMGIFGQVLGTKGLPAANKYVLQPGDRVEIYRPLLADPKAVRKERAERARQERNGKR